MKAGLVRYVDPYYSYNDEYEHSAFTVHEACGYISTGNNSIIVEFVVQVEPPIRKIVRGLIIPLGALIESAGFKGSFTNEVCDSTVRVEWVDVALVSNTKRISPSRMLTEGILKEIGSDYVVIQKPVTNRIYPLPKRKHPELVPELLVLPQSLIMSMRAV